MKYLLILIYNLFYVKIPIGILQKWLRSNNTRTLSVVAQKGHYKNRLYLAKHIASLHITGQHKLIGILLDDPVQVISKTTIQVAKTLRLLDELQITISEKEAYWITHAKKQEERKEAYLKVYKNLPQYKRKFSNGESYQQMKQALKKGMNIGKWI